MLSRTHGSCFGSESDPRFIRVSENRKSQLSSENDVALDRSWTRYAEKQCGQRQRDTWVSMVAVSRGGDVGAVKITADDNGGIEKNTELVLNGWDELVVLIIASWLCIVWVCDLATLVTKRKQQRSDGVKISLYVAMIFFFWREEGNDFSVCYYLVILDYYLIDFNSFNQFWLLLG